jgi:hypothetical protein
MPMQSTFAALQQSSSLQAKALVGFTWAIV